MMSTFFDFRSADLGVVSRRIYIPKREGIVRVAGLESYGVVGVDRTEDSS